MQRFSGSLLGKLRFLVSFWVLTCLLSSQAFAVNDPATFNFAVFGASSVSIIGGSFIDSYQGAPSDLVKGQGQKGNIGTNSVQGCAIQVNNGAKVNGQALAGYGGNPATGVCVSGGAQLTGGNGTLLALKNMTPKIDPGGGTPMGALSVLNGTSKTIGSGTYRCTSITVGGGGTLTLDGQVTIYLEGNLTVNNGATLAVKNGPATLYVKGQKVDFAGGSLINGTQDPKNLTIYGLAGLQTVNLSGGSTQHVQVYAPTAAIVISGGQKTFGSLIGNTIAMSNGASVHFPEITDAIAPVIDLTSPLSGDWVKTPMVTLAGTVSEPVSSVTVNGSAAQVTGTSFSLAGVQLVEGANALDVVATDLFGNRGTLAATLNLDTVAPTLAVTAPVADLLTKNPLLTVTGTLSEDYLAVDVNGAAATVSARNFSKAVTLAEGVNEFTVQATDRAGNAGSASFKVTLDSTPPTAPVLSAPASPTNTPSITVSGSAEAGSTVRLSRGTTSVGSATADQAGRFSFAGIGLIEGSNSLTATATDLAGNTSAVSDPVVVVLDTAAPAATVSTPVLGAYLKTPTVSVAGTVDDPSVKVTVNGRPAVVTGSAFNLDGVSLVEGGNTLTVVVTDPAGNSTTYTVTVTLDTKAPQLSVSTLANGSATNNPTLNLTGTATDNTGVAELRVNGVLVPVASDGSYSYAQRLQAGANSVEITVTDLAGNQTSDSRSITLDQNAPVITLTTPADNSKTKLQVIDILGSLNKQAAVEVKLKDTVLPAVMDGLNFSSSLTLEYGVNTIEISALDPAGNRSSVKRTVVFDDRKPSLAVIEPGQDQRTNQPSLTIKGTAGDELSAVSIVVTVEGQIFTPELVNGAFEQVLNFGAQKSYSITVTATDEVGLSASVQRNVIYDTTAPALTIAPVTTPTNQSVQLISGTREENALITVSSPSATIGPVGYPSSTAWQCEVTSLGAELNTIGVSAADLAGNVTSLAAEIVYDTTAPTGSCVINGGAVLAQTTRVNLDLSAWDGHGVNQMQFSNDGTTWSDPEPFAATRAWELTPGDGAKQVLVRFSDLAGNWTGSIGAGILLDTTPPVVAAAPAGGLFRTAQSVTLSASEASIIYYTTDGSAPTTASAIYGEAIQLPASATLQFFATDAAGNSGPVKSEEYRIDGVAPLVTISSPGDGAFLKSQAVLVSGTVNEPVSSVTVNGAEAALSGFTWSLPYTLHEGLNSFTVSAVDLAGNPGTGSVAVTLDTQAPTVLIGAPAAGLLTKNARLTVNGTVSEEAATVLVNSRPAEVSGRNWSLSYDLVEGANTLNVVATDRAGNSGSSAVTVTLDSTAPAVPVLVPPATPTKVAGIALSGSAEANAQVKVFSGTALLGTVTASAQGHFTLPGITLVEGANSFSAAALDAAGNLSAESAAVTAVLDTHAPVITVAAPEANSFFSVPQATVKGSVDEPVASLTVNGQAVTVGEGGFEQVITLTPGANSITLSATDLAGNSASKTVLVSLDATAPVVTISAPVSGGVTRTAQVTVTGTVNEANTSLTLNGTPASLTGQAFSVSYLLQEGENMITVEATDRAGNKGSAAVALTLDTQAPSFSLQAPAAAAAGANLDLALAGSDNNRLTLVELKADGVPIWSGGDSASLNETVAYRLSPSLNAGSEVLFQARGLDSAGNEGSASARVRITQAAMGPGYLQGKVLDDTRGLRLEGATVSVTDSKAATSQLVAAADGGYFTETAAGSCLVTVSQPGFTSVERLVTVLPEKKATALDARLTRISAAVNLIDLSGGVVRSELGTGAARPALEVTLPSGAVSRISDVRLTPLSNQGLPGLLPAGWSPLGAADLRLLDPASGAPLEGALGAGTSLKFPIAASLQLPADAVLVLAAYDPAAHQWQAKGPAALAEDRLSASANISGAGQYALVIGDPAPTNPPAAEAGTALSGTSSASLDFASVTAQGKVVPQAAPPSTGLKAAGEVVLTAKDGETPVFTSGLVLNSLITEKFDLKAGDTVETPAYTQDIVLYRYPCLTSIGAGELGVVDAAQLLRTTFPVSPSRDYSIVDLLLGKVGLNITVPDAGETGVMVGADGGRLVDADGNILVIPQGALSQTTPVLTKNGVAATGAVGDDFTLLKVVELNLTRQTLTRGATLSCTAPENFNASLPVVVAKQIEVKGVAKLKLVALGKLGGTLISSDTALSGVALPGITSSGTYYFLQAKAPLGFVSGHVTDAGNGGYPGALVKTDTGSLVDLTSSAGSYLVAAPVAPVSATALDLYKNDQVSGSGSITSANQLLTLDLKILMIPPTVVSVTPSGVNVQPNTPVVATFSKAIDKNTVTAANFKVADAQGRAVAGVFTHSVDGKTVTFSPGELFVSETAYSVTLTGGIRDLQGYALGGEVNAGFTVRKTTPPPMPAAGAVSGSFPDADGFITVTGTQGSAETGSTVLLINDATGEIASVTPASNGSFSGRVRGQLGDQIKVVVMDHSGNQTVVSYITYKSEDGKYLVTAKGGKVEGEGGLLLDIPEGALVGPTIVTLSPVAQESLASPVPDKGTYLGAVKIDTGGMPLQKPVEVSMPIPAGFDTNTAVFITKPSQIHNGDGTMEEVYEIVDSTKIVGNRISSACEPFPGVFGDTVVFTAFVELSPIVVSGYTYQERNGEASFQPPPDGVVETPVKDPVTGNLTYQFDRPIQRAVIRSPDAWNYVSYTNSTGFYGTFASMAVLPPEFAGPDANCKRYRITAINPQTMFRSNFDGYACAPPYNVRRVNFKLADKDTIPPDRTAPVINMSLQAVAGQPAENRLVAGTTIAGTKVNLPVSVIDQAVASANLTVKYSQLGSDAGSSTPVTLMASGAPVFHAYLKEEQANLYRTDYIPQFSSDSTANWFTPEEPGYYTFTVEAVDGSGNRNSRSLQLHVIQAGASLGTPIDGAPRVDNIFPGDGSKDIMVTTQVVATFSEPVQGAETNFKLYDLTATPPAEVPATVIVGIEGGRMQATLIPRGNLFYARDYKVVLTGSGISDTATNLSTGGILQMAGDFVATFRTKDPSAYDLATDKQFSGGRDIDLYTFTDVDDQTDTYAYIAAGENGWRISDVTDPGAPAVIHTASSTCNPGVDPDCRYVPREFNYRSVAVHPDRARALMAMTENITYADGNQYGYIRFYDLSSDPGNPPIIGRERLAEAYSGIPGRLALWGDYAVVNTAVAGIQVVNAKQAIKNVTDGKSSDGSSIVGALDTEGQGYGSPNDLAIFNERSAVFTTNPGYLLTVDLNLPSDPTAADNNESFMPVVISAFRPAGYNFTRVAVASGFPYTDASGSEQTINLAVTGSGQGKIATLDLTDPSNPQILGVAVKEDGSQVIAYARDITVDKDAGLAFVTTYNAIQVYDLKDPTHPRLLNEISSIADPSGATNPDGSPVLIPIGETPAIVEKGGWVYLANATKGMRTLDLDPAKLVLSCYDQLFCNDREKSVDIYPALGWRRVLLRAIDTSSKGADLRNAVLRVANATVLNGLGVEIQGSGGQPNSVKVDSHGYGWLFVKGDERRLAGRNKFVAKFEIDPASAPGLTEPATVNVSFMIRNNSNVTMANVLADKAVFTYDRFKLFPGRKVAGTAESERKSYFVQQLLNQVVTRKRSYANSLGSTYKLLKEDGYFDSAMENGVKAFKTNFGMAGMAGIGNTTASYSFSNGVYSYNAADDTSSTFRNLMRDYGITDQASASQYLHKIVDRSTLVGNGVSPADNKINGTVGSLNDTGLYELYKFVVEKYLTAMKEEGERYAGERGSAATNTAPTDNWTSRLTSVTVKNKNGAVTTKVGYGPVGSSYLHGIGMSYSYGGSNKIVDYNGRVTGCGAADAVSGAYSGNADKTTCVYPGADGRYAGLRMGEYLSAPQFSPTVWAGIDCSGLLSKMVKNAENTLTSDLVAFGNITKTDHGPAVSVLRSSSYSNKEYFTMGSVADLDLIHGGDIALYNKHVTMVYTDDSVPKNVKGLKYKVLHAFGNDTYRYPNSLGNGFEATKRFSRKVTITGDLGGVIQFGRLKLWK